MDYSEFSVAIKRIRDMGYIETHRTGDTGVGKTLEDLLGIPENAVAGPDFATYELKSARKNSSSMLTLFTKVPQPKGANASLLSAFGYKTRNKLRSDVSQQAIPRDKLQEPPMLTNRDKELHITIDSLRYNSLGLILEMKGDRLVIGNKKGVEAYYEREYLREAFERKYAHELIYVLAENQRVSGSTEKFWFNEALLLSGFSFFGFSDLVKKGIVKLDLRLGHYADGRPHDHGTGFRVLPRNLPQCFSKVERIL
jgi:hypothetical protein